MNSLFYTWIHFCTHEFTFLHINSLFSHEFTFLHMNSLFYTWIHFFTHEFTFLSMNSLFYPWIHFFKKLISFWNSLFHLWMIWLVWHTYRHTYRKWLLNVLADVKIKKEFFFQINFILKFTFSSSNDLISVTDIHTYIHTGSGSLTSYQMWKCKSKF